jgi:hypothetical protein
MLAECADVGECPDYLVRPQNSEVRSRVTTERLTFREVTDPVCLRLDPACAARVPGPNGG